MDGALHHLGITGILVGQYRGDIDALVNRRNFIAHGDSHSGVSLHEFSNWGTKIDRVMTDISILIYDYFNHKHYLLSSLA